MKKLYILIIAISFGLSVKYTIAQTMVTFYTTMGNFEAEMYETLTPITAGNFISLVEAKFYDGIIFHRIIEDFVIQGGDPLGTGYGGPGYTIMDEFGPGLSNIKWTLSMANSGPNTGGSQFFINVVDNTFLDPLHPVFGMVISGFSVVEAIEAVPTNSFDKPLTDVVMDSVRVTFDPVFLAEINNNAYEISVSPNPVTDESSILVNLKTPQAVVISIYDQLGRRIYNESINLLSGVNTISCKEMKTGYFSNGVYYIVVNDGINISTKKIVAGS